MSIFQIVFLIIASIIIAVTAFGALYQMFFAVVYLFLCKKRQISHTPKHHFTILIPAHNESECLPSVLNRCLQLDYPSDLFAVVVIADNCTDNTAQIAQDCGAQCLERFDNHKRGKGEALEWAIPQVLTQKTDVVLILDADCYLDSQSLKACDFEVARGNHVVQLSYLVSNPDVSFRCYAMALARWIENKLFYWAKSRIGLAGFLIGSGMVLHRDILERFPWQSGGLNEDFEYCFHLLKNGIKPVFIGDIVLDSPFPVEIKQLAVQRARWIFGGLDTLRRSVIGLLARGLFKQDFIAFDAGIAMLFISRPIIFGQIFLSGIFGLLSFFLIPSVWSCVLWNLFCGTLGLYVLYVGIGIFAMGLNKRRLTYMCLTPIFVFRYLEITAKSILIWRTPKWERTPRNHEEN
ncbi:MAG: glycosyltransferase family 2 protein [Planctomycetaceae bacterium]|jgi:cellulose synthase/poly-beta-1,6-N-acetylglucosamine synthase-like glycosyltransferase|nr:glycosyltransferase family 2 protein [Planctomycetaceae bacterium]